MTTVQTIDEHIDELNHLALQPRDLAEDLRQGAIPIVRRDELKRFETDTDPTGAPWAKLSPVTIRKKGHDRILEETEALKAAETSDAEGNIAQIETDADGATLTHGVDTSVDKGGIPWLPVQQFGSAKRNIPARPSVGLSEEAVDELANDLADREMRTWSG